MVILKPSWAALTLLTCVIFLGLFTCQLSGVLVEDLWGLPWPCRGLLPPWNCSPVSLGLSSCGMSPPWFWNPNVLCSCSVLLTALKMEPQFRGSLLRLHPVRVPSWNFCQSGLPHFFLAAPQFFFSFWMFRVPTLSSSTSRFPKLSLLVSRCSPSEQKSLLSQISLDSDRLPLAESPSTVGPYC